MDYNGAEPTVDIYGDDGPHNQYEDEEDYPQEMYSAQQQHQNYPRRDYDSNVDDSSARHELKHSIDDSSAGKLFVGGIAWETREEAFTKYFSKYGEISDSVIMMDKFSGRPRGFGFVTFADPEVANRVLQEDHVIDGRTVEVKRTVPRGENMQNRGIIRTKKIFVGGIPLSLTEDDLRDYFSSYGNIVEHQIMIDRNTGRPRGFGFVTFETEDSVERIFSDGRMHELDGKRVEIKRAQPKQAGFDHGQENRMRRGSGSTKSYGSFSGDQPEFGGGYGGKMGRGYGGYNGYGGYGGYPANLTGGGTGFYPGYGGYGYGFGFGGPMYGGGAGYGGGGYGNPAGYGVSGAYGGGKGYGGTGYGGGASASGYGGAKSYGGGGSSGGGASKGYGNGGGASGRFHPYRK
ncbi:hypothetical protein Leryth_026946 [Lithospermum erythrorhizon]|nr:hypothetical protein Leryth_026946 [Lithospermum erythrorhizon]